MMNSYRLQVQSSSSVMTNFLPIFHCCVHRRLEGAPSDSCQQSLDLFKRLEGKVMKTFFSLNVFLSHVVRSISKSYEFPQGLDYQNMFCPYVQIEGLCSLNLVTAVFWYFCPKNGSKSPKSGPKMPWFGLVWLGLVIL